MYSVIDSLFVRTIVRLLRMGVTLFVKKVFVDQVSLFTGHYHRQFNIRLYRILHELYFHIVSVYFKASIMASLVTRLKECVGVCHFRLRHKVCCYWCKCLPMSDRSYFKSCNKCKMVILHEHFG